MYGKQLNLLIWAAALVLAFGCGNTRGREYYEDASFDEDAFVDTDGWVSTDGAGYHDATHDVDAGTQYWVKILSPLNHDVVENPVTIEYEAGQGVRWVSIEADEWPLHDGYLDAGQGVHTYSFMGVGYERHLVLYGYDDNEEWVASDEVRFTIDAPDMVFPIKDEPGLILSRFDNPSSSAAFGSSRSGGRVHAGCDLYWTDDGALHYKTAYYILNNDTPIYAVTDGVIVSYTPFYLGTYALVVDHGDFTIRYGEVCSGGLPGSLTVGSNVNAGQHIAYMGDLAMSSGTWAMLHLEMYSNDFTGPLTDTSNYNYINVPNANYQRRGDLMDCGPFLLSLLD